MSEFELHGLIADLFRDMRGMTEFWLSGTFAVIVARFIAGDTLSRRTIWVMALLYLAVTGLSLSQITTVFLRNLDYQSQLTSMGLDFFFPPGLVTLIAAFQFVLFFGGTVTIAYFLLGRKAPMYAAGPELGTSAG